MRLAPTASCWLTVLAPLFVDGCGARTSLTPDPTPVEDAPPSDIAACTLEETANCTRFEACYANALSNEYSSVDECISRRSLLCIAILTAPDTVTTRLDVTACAAAIPTESCESLLNGDPEPAACVAPGGPGGRARGVACEFGAQCSTGFCGLAPGSACGTCQEPPTAGASCANLTSCGPKLWCFEGTCVASAATGSPCDPAQPCVVGSWCVIAPGAAGGVCEPQATTLGAPCVRRNAAVPGPGCDSTLGLSCFTYSTGQSACQTIETATVGQECNTVDFVSTLPEVLFCVDGSVCTAQADGTARCVARAADGAACNTVTGALCVPPASCVGSAIAGGAAGTCTLPGTAACL